MESGNVLEDYYAESVLMLSEARFDHFIEGRSRGSQNSEVGSVPIVVLSAQLSLA